MIHLGINIDHIATLRQARMGIEPEPIYAAMLAEQNGADQITVHLREDRRHIQLRDVKLLKQTIQTRLNLEMAATEEMVTFAKSIKPETVTLVPEKREELTTEGGLLLVPEHELLIKELQAAGIEVSVFIEPDLEMIKLASIMGANAVEIHTGKYANLETYEEKQEELQKLKIAGKYIQKLGMRAVAGHGINFHNVHALVELGVFEEYNIGHSIIARAVFTSLPEAVSKMKKLINGEE
jgi:pyridoxine 5-phosphate synthase